MKKLFFTAIAMIAFSSASMSNNILLEEIEIKHNLLCQEKKTTQIVLKKERDCTLAFLTVFMDLAQSGSDFETAYGVASAVQNLCNFSNQGV